MVNRGAVKILFTTIGDFIAEVRQAGHTTADRGYYLVDKVLMFDREFPTSIGEPFLEYMFRKKWSEPLEFKSHAVAAEQHVPEDVLDAYEAKVIECETFGVKESKSGDIEVVV
jgi:hypothetical protein